MCLLLEFCHPRKKRRWQTWVEDSRFARFSDTPRSSPPDFDGVSYANGVPQPSPASRSAPWERTTTPRGFLRQRRCTPEPRVGERTLGTLWNPFGVRGLSGAGPRVRLRRPWAGLSNALGVRTGGHEIPVVGPGTGWCSTRSVQNSRHFSALWSRRRPQ